MAHPDMDLLLDEAIRAAIYFLEKNGEFFPFAITMSQSGEITHVQGYVGEEHPPSQDVIDLLQDGLKQRGANGELRATALISDVRVSLPDGGAQDAVSVTVEHQDDEPVTGYLPYTKDGEGFGYGDLFAERAPRLVFPAQS